MSRRLPENFVEDRNVQKNVLEFLSSFDEHIKDFRVEKVPNDGASKDEVYRIAKSAKKGEHMLLFCLFMLLYLLSYFLRGGACQYDRYPSMHSSPKCPGKYCSLI